MLLILFLALNLYDTPRPNIIFILADDPSIGDVNCHSAERCQIDTFVKGGFRIKDVCVQGSSVFTHAGGTGDSVSTIWCKLPKSLT